MKASDLPVMVDGDNGYGDVKNVVHVLHSYERLGVAAIMFEDQVAPKRCGHIAGKDVIPAADMAAKIRAAAESRMNRDTFILARTDARGMVMAIREDFTLVSVHSHLLLLGWATLALTGIVYLVLPRCGGTRLAAAHFWLHNIGLPVMMASLAAEHLGVAQAKPLIGLGSTVATVGLGLFTVNVFRSASPPDAGA